MAADQRQSVVFIDMDRTLLEGPFISVVFPWVIGEISKKTGRDFASLLRRIRQESLDRLANPAFSAVQAMDWDDIFSCVAGELGVSLEASALDLVLSHPGPPFTSINPGALEALQQLSADRSKRALVLATKGLRKYQVPILEASGLLTFFDDILTPDNRQVVKQSRAFYDPWPAKTRLQIMVGDLFEDDILPAHQFGFKTIWCTWENQQAHRNSDPFARAQDNLDVLGDQPTRPDAVIVSLHELPQVVERMEDAFFNS